MEEIKYIDKDGLKEIFRIINEKDAELADDVAKIMSAMSAQLQEANKIINALKVEIDSIRQDMLTIDNFKNGFKTDKATKDISVKIADDRGLEKLLQSGENGVNYTDKPGVDMGNY